MLTPRTSIPPPSHLFVFTRHYRPSISIEYRLRILPTTRRVAVDVSVLGPVHCRRKEEQFATLVAFAHHLRRVDHSLCGIDVEKRRAVREERGREESGREESVRDMSVLDASALRVLDASVRVRRAVSLPAPSTLVSLRESCEARGLQVPLCWDCSNAR